MKKIIQGIAIFVSLFFIFGAIVHCNKTGEPGSVVFAILLAGIILFMLFRKKRIRKPSAKTVTWTESGTLIEQIAENGVIRCLWCDTEVPEGANHCVSCGAAVRILEPGVIACGWCGTFNNRYKHKYCKSCGGLLPSLPGKKAGGKPPDPPRKFPRGYLYRRLWKTNIPGKFSALMVVLSVIVCVLPIIGLPLVMSFLGAGIFLLFGMVLSISIYWSSRALRPLRHGIPTKGVLSGIRNHQNTGEKPFLLLDFQYEIPEGKYSCTVSTSDPINTTRVSGEHFWVVYLQENPERSALWPPIE